MGSKIAVSSIGPNSISNSLMIGNEIQKHQNTLGSRISSRNITMSASDMPKEKRTYLTKLVQGGLRSKVKMQSATLEAPLPEVDVL